MIGYQLNIVTVIYDSEKPKKKDLNEKNDDVFCGIGFLVAGKIVNVNAQQGLIETVANGCRMEIDKYCGQVRTHTN